MLRTRVVRWGLLSSLAVAFLASVAYAQHSNSLPRNKSWTAHIMGAVTVGSGWQLFFWDATPHPSAVTDNPFTFTLTAPGYVAVVDAGFDGDQFQVFDGTTLLGDTTVPLDDGQYAGDATTAWANSAFSRRIFPLSAGAHSINVFVIRSATCTDCAAGAGFLRVGLDNDGFYSPPIPALGLAGLVGLAALLAAGGFILLRRG